MNVSVVPAGSDGLVAVAANVIEPASTPVTVFVATPDAAVDVPSPETVPAPAVFANVTTVELSLVTVLPFASLIVAVSNASNPTQDRRQTPTNRCDAQHRA